MCRNIRKLRSPAGAPTEAELQDAALQFVRKISGYRIPSAKNAKAFDGAVREITRAAKKMFDGLAPAKPGVLEEASGSDSPADILPLVRSD